MHLCVSVYGGPYCLYIIITIPFYNMGETATTTTTRHEDRVDKIKGKPCLSCIISIYFHGDGEEEMKKIRCRSISMIFSDFPADCRSVYLCNYSINISN